MANTPLSKALAGGPPQAPALSVSESALRRRFAGAGRRGEDVDFPALGRARVELVGARRGQEIEGEVLKEMTRLGFTYDITTVEKWELERAIRTLAEGVRDPDDHALAFGTLSEWEAVDSLVIASCWTMYGDVAERLDPMAAQITMEQGLQIERAVKKNDAMRLRSFGVAKLSAWLASMGSRLSISPLPNSSSSESAPDR